jgi:hypothetical protein
MGHLKECVASNRLSVGRSKAQSSCRPTSQSERINSSTVASNEFNGKKSTFAEDFMLEHSHAGLLVAVMGRAATYVGASREMHKSTQHYGFPS